MPTPLSARFDPNAASHDQEWATLWTENITPWDRSEPSPAVIELLQLQPILRQCAEAKVDKKKALVPGCGRGYDVGLFSRELDPGHFQEVIGLEVSPGAVDAAAGYLSDKKGDVPATVVLGDFFDKDDAHLQEPFALVYDFTFLCALPPHRRPAWAQRMAEIIAPGGLLITLQREDLSCALHTNKQIPWTNTMVVHPFPCRALFTITCSVRALRRFTSKSPARTSRSGRSSSSI
jgi:hypothetical protein